MEFKINPKVFTQFANPRIAVTVVQGVDNTGAGPVQPETTAIIKTIREQYDSATLSQVPQIAAWREAYRAFGAKAKDYPSSIEALYKRLLRDQSLDSINPLVDIYNYVSLKHLLPAGGEDLAKLQGDVELTFAGDDEVPVTVLGRDEPQAPSPGEVIYKDAAGTICRRWNWREVARAILTDQTTDCILVLEALDPVSDQELVIAQTELSELVEQHCGAETTNFILDIGTLSASW